MKKLNQIEIGLVTGGEYQDPPNLDCHYCMGLSFIMLFLAGFLSFNQRTVETRGCTTEECSCLYNSSDSCINVTTNNCKCPLPTPPPYYYE